jgi:hypothetical protein
VPAPHKGVIMGSAAEREQIVLLRVWDEKLVLIINYPNTPNFFSCDKLVIQIS